MRSEPVRPAGLIEAALDAKRDHGRRPFLLGIAGAQGSGKSTVARELADRFAARGLNCALLSLDDLYLSGAERQALAERIHPLLRTRGVPGTHDPARGLALVEALGEPRPIPLPRFDKAADEPGTPEPFTGPADIVILEGWCVGARPQDDAALIEPVNALEREHDPDGSWRRYANDALAGPYRALFDRIDLLVLLAAPGFDIVAGWRIEQERNAGGPMTDDQVRDFVRHYQRITEGLLRHGPAWADLVIRLNATRRVVG